MQYNGSKWGNAAVSSGSCIKQLIRCYNNNGDVLVWNSSTSKYINSSIISGTNSLINLNGNSYVWYNF